MVLPEITARGLGLPLLEALVEVLRTQLDYQEAAAVEPVARVVMVTITVGRPRRLAV
jgi:hypothetical protein